MQCFISALKVLLSAQPTADRLAAEPQLTEPGFPDTALFRPVLGTELDVAVVTGAWLFL